MTAIISWHFDFKSKALSPLSITLKVWQKLFFQSQLGSPLNSNIYIQTEQHIRIDILDGSGGTITTLKPISLPQTQDRQIHTVFRIQYNMPNITIISMTSAQWCTD